MVGFCRIPSRTSAIGTPLLYATVASFSVGNLPAGLDEEAIMLLLLRGEASDKLRHAGITIGVVTSMMC